MLRRSSMQVADFDPATETPPVLVGDGVTDDTDAVRWRLERGMPITPSPSGRGYNVRFSDLPEGGYSIP